MIKGETALVMLWTAFVFFLASAENDEWVREFRAIEEARSLALKIADLAALDRLYAEDFVGISASGEKIVAAQATPISP